MRLANPIYWTLAGLALCVGLWFAIDAAWVCDDAFISFRYAKNFVDGLGLVYNAGEYVEGYTNFLWVILVAAGMSFGADPIVFCHVLGLAFFVATVGILWHVAARTKTVPIAAIGLAIHEHSLLFSTCGLETAMFGFFVTAGLVQLIVAERTPQFVWGGLALILATMSRPDGALFYAIASFVVLAIARRHRSWRPLVGYAAPFVLLYLPYFFWKLDYYGYPFPNTFYAKSASDPFFSQGLYYVGLYFGCYFLLIPALAVPAFLSFHRRVVHGATTAAGVDSDAAGFEGRRGPLLIALFTLPYLAYVAWVGGDFMFGRFCLPVTPALFLGLQYLGRSPATAPVLVGLLLLCSFRVPPPAPAGSEAEPAPLELGSLTYPRGALKPGNARNVVEERSHYPAWYVEAYRKLGRRLRDLFAASASGSPAASGPRVAIGGAQAMLAYFGEFPYVLELHGLTDEFIAHREIDGRGRIGHEKILPLDHEYLRERGVDMIVGAYTQVGVPDDTLAPQRKFEFFVTDVPFFGKSFSDFGQATLLRYDRALLDPLSGDQTVRFTPFPRFLDTYILMLGDRPVAQVRKDLRAFDRFYFRHNADKARREKIEARLHD